MDAVECLGNVKETDCEKGLELVAFLHDASQREYLLYTGTLWSGSCLSFSQRVANHFSHAIVDHLAADPPQDRQKRHPSPAFTLTEYALLRNVHYCAVLPVLGNLSSVSDLFAVFA